MLRLDIGCGLAKHLGFIGLDRAPMPGVDVVADLDRVLPFEDDSVDLLLACHSLEHVSDLIRTLKELYRVCKHGAQVCLVAPYANQALCIANPYHIAPFNEHTPRFWTCHKSTRVSRDEFDHPHAPDWGLSRSDNSDPGIDIRLVRMEFFYFPEHVHKPQEELRRLRVESMDVCDQVMYHLLVWKDASPSGEAEFDAHADSLQPYIPDVIARRYKSDSDLILRRLNDRLEAARRDLALQTERASELERVQLEAANLRERNAVLEGLNAELLPLRAESERWRAEAASIHKQDHDRNALVGLLKAQLDQHQAELERWRVETASLRMRETNQSALADTLKAEFEHRRSELAALRNDLNDARREMATLSAERLSDLAQAQAETEQLRSKLELASGRIQVLTAEAALRDDMISRFEQIREAERERNETLELNSGEIRSLKQTLECRLEKMHSDLAAAFTSSTALERNRARAALLQAELETANAILSSAAEQNARLVSEIEAVKLRSRRFEADAARQAATVAGHNRLLQREAASLRLLSPVGLLRFGPYVLGRLHGGSPECSVEQQKLISAVSKVVPGAARCLVALSCDIREVPYIEFCMRTPVRGSLSFRLAVLASDCGQPGLIGLELVSSSMRIAAQVAAPLSEGSSTGIVTFAIPDDAPLLSGAWFLRVFAREAESCVRILILRRGALGFHHARDFPVALPAIAGL